MSTRTVLSDEHGNALSCYLNTKGEAYISIHQEDEGPLDGNFIVLDKSDLSTFIDMLQDMKDNMR